MKLTRDTWIAIGILLALIVVISAAALQQSKGLNSISYLSTSSAPDGILALKLWLHELGYPSIETAPAVFDPVGDIKTIFILQPILSITEGEWKLLDQWVERGGVLILAGDNSQSMSAFKHFEFSPSFLQGQPSGLAPAAPILNSPSLTEKAAVKTDMGLDSARTDFTPLMNAGGSPVIVTFEQGQGRVILSATPYLFSNAALKDDTAAALVLNIIALSGAKNKVWFDEWHHGFQAGSIIGPSEWLQNTPGGHALLFVVGAIFLAMLLQGQAFGRPVPLIHEIKRRGPLEHVTAIANLNRKAGHRNEVLSQYRQRVKRHLGQRYRLDPSMNDTEYVNLLADYNPAIDRDALLILLKRLSQKNISEAELLKLAAEAARWIND
jgi:hypothetical protein